ncbi:hypothetical protein GCM10027416_30640 [Okibacterium endophyticum]
MSPNTADRLARQGGDRGIEGLQGRERHDVEPVDHTTGQARAEIGDERVYFWQLWHVSSLRQTGDIRPLSA